MRGSKFDLSQKRKESKNKRPTDNVKIMKTKRKAQFLLNVKEFNPFS